MRDLRCCLVRQVERLATPVERRKLVRSAFTWAGKPLIRVSPAMAPGAAPCNRAAHLCMPHLCGATFGCLSAEGNDRLGPVSDSQLSLQARQPEYPAKSGPTVVCLEQPAGGAVRTSAMGKFR